MMMMTTTTKEAAVAVVAVEKANALVPSLRPGQRRAWGNAVRQTKRVAETPEAMGAAARALVMYLAVKSQ
jgi:hypothetical protein